MAATSFLMKLLISTFAALRRVYSNHSGLAFSVGSRTRPLILSTIDRTWAADFGCGTLLPTRSRNLSMSSGVARGVSHAVMMSLSKWKARMGSLHHCLQEFLTTVDKIMDP